MSPKINRDINDDIYNQTIAFDDTHSAGYYHCCFRHQQDGAGQPGELVYGAGRHDGRPAGRGRPGSEDEALRPR